MNYALNHNGCEVINIGTGKGYSVLEVVKAYEKASGKKINYKITDRRPGDIDICYADPSKAKKLLDFQTQVELEQMCLDSYNFMINNPEGIK